MVLATGGTLGTGCLTECLHPEDLVHDGSALVDDRASFVLIHGLGYCCVLLWPTRRPRGSDVCKTGAVTRVRSADEVAAKQAMRHILYRGLIEIRASAHRARRALPEDGAGEVDDVLSRVAMLANTLHHVPSYMSRRSMVKRRRPRGVAEPPWSRRMPAVNWFASLWQYRSPEQEEWLLEVLAGEKLTPLAILGTRDLRTIEENRRALMTRMTLNEAEALAARVRAEGPYDAVVSQRGIEYFVAVTGTTEGMVPLWWPGAWDYWRRELAVRSWRRRVRNG